MSTMNNKTAKYSCFETIYFGFLSLVCWPFFVFLPLIRPWQDILHNNSGGVTETAVLVDLQVRVSECFILSLDSIVCVSSHPQVFLLECHNPSLVQDIQRHKIILKSYS